MPVEPTRPSGPEAIKASWVTWKRPPFIRLWDRLAHPEGFSDQLVRSTPGLVVVDDRDDHHLLRAIFPRDRIDLRLDRHGRADDEPAAGGYGSRIAHLLRQKAVRRVDSRHRGKPPGLEQVIDHSPAGREAPGLLVRGGAYRGNGDRCHRRFQMVDRSELRAVAGRDSGAARLNEVGEHVRKAKLRRPDSALR